MVIMEVMVVGRCCFNGGGAECIMVGDWWWLRWLKGVVVK